jgi:outer membrane protein OmpA-like peptidoglycan-associated protein
MGDLYNSGVWAKRYEHLPPTERADVNLEADRRFRERTGVSRMLDPKKDPALIVRWLRIRDEVMAQLSGKGTPDPRKTASGLVLWLPSPIKQTAFLLLYNYDIGSDKPKLEHLKTLDGVVGPLINIALLDLWVGVEGHASRTGGDAYDNQGLSERRAAEVDKHLRKIGRSSITFFKAGGWGSKQQVSIDPSYRDAWPYLESLDEDERDRSVVITIKWQPVHAIDSLKQPNVDWNKAFDQAAPRAALWYALQMGIKIVADYAPSPKIKGVPIPWNPATGFPNSWTTGRPDADAVLQAMGKMMIDEVEQAARNAKLDISRDEIIRHYQDWLKNPDNKWSHR